MNRERIILWVTCLLLAMPCAAEGPAPTRPAAMTIHPNHMTRSGWTEETLTRDTIKRGNGERRDHWLPDATAIPEAKAGNPDYHGSHWSRFHHAACDDFATQAGKDSTFNYANCSPGDQSLNVGEWLKLERHQRQVGLDYGEVRVATGPLWLPDPRGIITIRTIGDIGVWVPTHYFKALAWRDSLEEWHMEAWVVPNAPFEGDLSDYRVCVDDIERALGDDLFADLPEEVQAQLESQK